MAASVYSMETLELIDAETNKTYIIHLNTEDARKARDDMHFAYKLLENAKQNASGSGTEVQNNQSLCNMEQSTKATASLFDEDYNTDDPECNELDKQSNKEDVYIWSKKETLLLINLYKENEAMFTSGKTKQHSCWEHIAKKMAKKDYNVSGKKCCTKFQTLKRTYKQIKDHNNKSGNSRKTWEFLEDMNDLFGTKPWIQPITVAGSHIPGGKNSIKKFFPPGIPDKLEKPSCHQVTREKNKENKPSSTSYKQNLLDYRKHRTEQKDKQHQEKMNLLSEIKNLM